MPELQIQLRRDGEWCKVTTIRFEADHDGSRAKRRAAVREGFLKLSDWRRSDQFIGMPMRLAEPAGRWGDQWRQIERVSG